MLAAVREQDQELTRKNRHLASEILKQKVLLEKARQEESETSANLRQEEDDRDNLQSEFEITEQRNTMANFELQELQKMHEELNESLDAMKKENNSLVEPVLNGLRQEV